MAEQGLHFGCFTTRKRTIFGRVLIPVLSFLCFLSASQEDDSFLCILLFFCFFTHRKTAQQKGVCGFVTWVIRYPGGRLSTASVHALTTESYDYETP